MKSFLEAFGFLTIIPSGIKKGELSPDSMIYFPLVGAFLGIVLIVLDKMLFFILPISIVNIILILSITIITGGLHVDGLADTLDALSSLKERNEMLNIMRDSRIGTMGTLGVIFSLLLKIAFLSEISELRESSLFIMPVLGRWGMLLCIFLFNYAKKEGKGKIFFEGINIRIFSIATLFTIFITVITLELKGLVIFLNVLIFTIFLGKFFSSKIGGITGDILGATNELIEILTLSLILVSERYSWRVPFSLL